MDYESNETSINVEPPENKTVAADTVNVERSGVQSISATSATLRQVGVQNATAERLVLRQGGIVKANAETLEMLQASAALVQTGSARLTASNSGAVVAGGSVNMDQSAARVLVSGGQVDMDQAGAGLLVANNVRMENSAVVFLVSRNVEGNVTPMFGPRESILFGAVAGLIAGAMMMLGGLARRRGRKK
jgi:hypothetical protein